MWIDAAQACVHDYMKRRRRSENSRKQEALDEEVARQAVHVTDNLAVLASVSSTALDIVL